MGPRDGLNYRQMRLATMRAFLSTSCNRNIRLQQSGLSCDRSAHRGAGVIVLLDVTKSNAMMS